MKLYKMVRVVRFGLSTFAACQNNALVYLLLAQVVTRST